MWEKLILSRPGARVCVMGGAGSLALHLQQVEADIYLSCNGHGAELVTPDFVVAMDEHHMAKQEPMQYHIARITDSPIISPRTYADIRLATWPGAPSTFVLTGMVAAWVAYVMGASVVILAGMDGYGGAQVDRAREARRDIKCPVRVVGGGPLCSYWPEYDPAEKFNFQAHPALEWLRGIDLMSTFKALKKFSIPGREFQKDEVFQATHQEMHRPLTHRLVEEVAGKDKKPENGPHAEHKGRGKYDVIDATGNVIASGLSKDEAAAKVAEIKVGGDAGEEKAKIEDLQTALVSHGKQFDPAATKEELQKLLDEAEAGK